MESEYDLYLDLGEHKDESERWFFQEEFAVKLLIEEDLLFVNYVPYPYYKIDNLPETEQTITLYVNANDIWMWGCADACHITSQDTLESLCKMHLDDKKWGCTKWCCIQRNMKPQKPIASDMYNDGAWDDVMEQLPDNPFWSQCWATGTCALHGMEL